MFDYDRDIMQKKKKNMILANLSISAAVSIDILEMKYRHIVERSKIACTQFLE